MRMVPELLERTERVDALLVGSVAEEAGGADLTALNAARKAAEDRRAEKERAKKEK